MLWASFVTRNPRTDRNRYSAQHAFPSDYGPALCGAVEPPYSTTEDSAEPRCKRCDKLAAKLGD